MKRNWGYFHRSSVNKTRVKIGPNRASHNNVCPSLLVYHKSQRLKFGRKLFKSFDFQQFCQIFRSMKELTNTCKDDTSTNRKTIGNLTNLVDFLFSTFIYLWKKIKKILGCLISLLLCMLKFYKIYLLILFGFWQFVQFVFTSVYELFLSV